MKKFFGVFFGIVFSSVAQAQDPIGIVGAVTSKVIRAIDLAVQREQTQTILLQGAQKELENVMSALRLGEIQDWVEQLKDLYAGYFQELWQVKDVLSTYNKVATAVQRQEQIVAGCQQATTLFGSQTHFSLAELARIADFYSGVLSRSLQNLDQLTRAIQPNVFQLTDQDRMSMIDRAAAGMDQNYSDMQRFTNQTELIALQRASDENDYLTLKKMYGL